MATGRSNHLTKQTGEYLVAAELSRRGFIATTFTGNVPSYDIVAVSLDGNTALVQVKAIASGAWQLNFGKFADVRFDGPKQIVQGQLADPCRDLVCVMVKISPAAADRPDRFFVLPWSELGKIVIVGHKSFLAKHGGVRPRNPKSLHTAVYPKALADWEDRWQVLEKFR